MEQIEVISSVVLLGVAGFALWHSWQLGKRFSNLLKGKEGLDLEKALDNQLKRIDQLDAKSTGLEESYQKLATSSSLASQKISIVRFNPFGDTGGDQSFALAVLDAHESGYVLTSIHGREGTRVYVKPVDNGQSKYTLSEEEKKALKQASKRVIS